MSGNSNGNAPSINRPGPNENCKDLVLTTNLASPQLEVIIDLNVDDILSITAATDQGPIQAIVGNGQIAGNIISREQIRIMACIVAGTRFEAIVLAINQGQCTVQIRAV